MNTTLLKPFSAGTPVVSRASCSLRRLAASASLCVLIASAQAVGTYVCNENFNAMTVGGAPSSPWTTVATGGTVKVQNYPFAADHSINVNKTSTSGETRLARNFGNQSGRVVFEAKVMAAQTAGFKAIPYIYNSSGAAVASVSFQDGTLYTYVGPTKTAVQSFVANQWYLVRVIVDTSAGTYDLFVDGIRQQVNAPLRTASGSVDHLGFYMDGSNTGSLYVDNVKVYVESSYIGAAPTPLFDVRTYGAVGDGSANDTAAVQAAINACAGTGGSVYLSNGSFKCSTLTLKSNLTFWVASNATLLGSPNTADYPTQSPATGNTQLHNCRKALLYAPGVTQLKIDGGGTIDGNGGSFGGSESNRPMPIWTVLSNNVTIRNVYLKRCGMWSLVNMESDSVTVQNVIVNSASMGITRDGIDTVDGSNITIRDCTVNSGDDAICLKSGVRRGIVTMTVRDCFVAHSGSNGIKFGTATYGAFTSVTIQDCYVKDCQYAAMVLMSREGADVNGINFNRIQFADTGSSFFVFLGQQATTHPIGDVPKLGSMTDVHFTDTFGWTKATWGGLITGHLYNGTTYRIANLSFTNCVIVFKGGLTSVPGTPPEWNSTQYPEANMWGNLPAWGYYLRHVNGVTFSGCSSTVSPSDARSKLATNDVTGLVGAP